MKDFLLFLENLISGMLPLTFLVLAGAIFTYKTKAVQFRRFFASLKFSLSQKSTQEDGISAKGAICNSLAATVGTGNIAGVAAAITVGGAGAVFWMWVSAFFSMVIKAVEITVAVLYRKKIGQEYIGGPMYYIKEKMGKAGGCLSAIFSISCILSTFTTGNITQINACVSVATQNGFIKFLIGLGFALVVAFVIIGGAKKITKFTTAVLPLMAVLYIVFCLSVIIKNISLIDDAFFSIIKGAFKPSAVTGGAVGSLYTTVITGAQKGVFSNEAGLGTSGLAHAMVKKASPKTQGLFGMFEVFVDTLLICTLTALTILLSGVIIDYNSVASSELVNEALSFTYGAFSKPILTVMLCLFGISSILGWANYGITASRFLIGKKGERIFVLVYPLFCIVGALISVSAAWRIAEFFNGIMLIINIFAIIYLSKNAVLQLEESSNDKKDRKITKSVRKT
ncbi:MAG: sodium:alanine symporter family protein [Clostridia bacterium]|nr:sodium:alanine symporter family protein [Clostridia bacterium]